MWLEAVCPVVAPEYGKCDHFLAMHSSQIFDITEERSRNMVCIYHIVPRQLLAIIKGLAGATLGPVYVVSVDRAGPCLSVNNEFRNMFNL